MEACISKDIRSSATRDKFKNQSSRGQDAIRVLQAAHSSRGVSSFIWVWSVSWLFLRDVQWSLSFLFFLLTFSPSSASWVLSRWTSVEKRSSWRRASTPAGTLGATARRMTTCCPSGLSAWWVLCSSHSTGGSLLYFYLPSLHPYSLFLLPRDRHLAGSREAQDMPVWGWRVQGPQDGNHGWWRSQPVFLWFHRQGGQHHGQLWNVSSLWNHNILLHFSKELNE